MSCLEKYCGLEITLSHVNFALQPPTAVQPSENHPEHEAIEIAVTKLLLRSYYDIARKNIEDFVPKAIILFLVSCMVFLIVPFQGFAFLSSGKNFSLYVCAPVILFMHLLYSIQQTKQCSTRADSLSLSLFQVNHTKCELHNVLIENVYRCKNAICEHDLVM